MLFFSAMPLAELNIAKEIVLIGFGALLLTLSVSMIIVIAASRDSFKNFFDRDRKNQP